MCPAKEDACYARRVTKITTSRASTAGGDPVHPTSGGRQVAAVEQEVEVTALKGLTSRLTTRRARGRIAGYGSSPSYRMPPRQYDEFGRPYGGTGSPQGARGGPDGGYFSPQGDYIPEEVAEEEASVEILEAHNLLRQAEETAKRLARLDDRGQVVVMQSDGTTAGYAVTQSPPGSPFAAQQQPQSPFVHNTGLCAPSSPFGGSPSSPQGPVQTWPLPPPQQSSPPMQHPPIAQQGSPPPLPQLMQQQGLVMPAPAPPPPPGPQSMQAAVQNELMSAAVQQLVRAAVCGGQPPLGCTTTAAPAMQPLSPMPPPPPPRPQAPTAAPLPPHSPSQRRHESTLVPKAQRQLELDVDEEPEEEESAASNNEQRSMSSAEFWASQPAQAPTSAAASSSGMHLPSTHVRVKVRKSPPAQDNATATQATTSSCAAQVEKVDRATSIAMPTLSNALPVPGSNKGKDMVDRATSIGGMRLDRATSIGGLHVRV